MPVQEDDGACFACGELGDHAASTAIILKVERRKTYVTLNYTSNSEGKFGWLGYCITQGIFNILFTHIKCRI